TYRLIERTECNMCGAATSEAKTLGRRLSTRQGFRPTRRVGVATTVIRCRSCGLVTANPIPLPAHIGQHYELEPENYWDAEYIDTGSGDPRFYANRFRELWIDTGTPVALDVGAGLGHNMIALDQLGFDVYGVEPSESFRTRALEHSGIDDDRL